MKGPAEVMMVEVEEKQGKDFACYKLLHDVFVSARALFTPGKKGN